MNPNDPHTTGVPSDPLERALRAALRPVDPGVAFAAAVQSHLAATHAGAQIVPGAAQDADVPVVPATVYRKLHSASLALAASIVVALGIGAQLLELRAEQRTAQARVHTQLLLALEITSEHLGLAQQRIEQFQAQENRP
jgi:hypothetical protein